MNTHKSYLYYIRIIRASGRIAFILKGFESTSGPDSGGGPHSAVCKEGP